METLNEWAFVGVFFAIAWVFPALPIIGAWLVRPRKPNALKRQTYESGVETVGDTWVPVPRAVLHLRPGVSHSLTSK